MIYIFKPPRSKIGGHIVFIIPSLHKSVWKLNLAYNFWTGSVRAVISISLEFFVTRPFIIYTMTLEFDLFFFKTLTLFTPCIVTRTLIFKWQDLSIGTNIFLKTIWLWILIYFLKILNMLITFECAVRARAFAFYMSNYCDKTFFVDTTIFDSVALTLEFGLLS